jgi:hypothetical protein
MSRSPRKRGSKASKRGLSGVQIPVLICRDRAGSTTDFILEKDDKRHICEALKSILATDSVLHTDGSRDDWGGSQDGVAASPTHPAIKS